MWHPEIVEPHEAGNVLSSNSNIWFILPNYQSIFPFATLKEVLEKVFHDIFVNDRRAFQ